MSTPIEINTDMLKKLKTKAEHTAPVSYTHLDVYKRQCRKSRAVYNS